jgi:Domain of unknown function (DUF4864)
MEAGMVNLISRMMIGLFAALLTVAAYAGSPETPAQNAIDGQIRAFLADKDAEAYAFAAPNVRTYFPTVESFMGMVKSGYTPVYRPKNWDFGRVETTQTGGVMQEVLITDMTGKSWAALYTVEQQPDGNWKITGVSLKKSDAMTM